MKAIDRRVTNNPLQSLKHVPLHLGEHLFIIKPTAHLLKLSDRRHIFFAIPELGRYQEGGAADELIVPLVDNTS